MDENEKRQKYLHSLYISLSEKGGSLASALALYHSVLKDNKYKFSLSEIQKFLEGEDAYTLHRGFRTRFPSKKVIVGGLNQLHQGDLLDISKFKDFNDNVTFLLVVEDCFSKFLWVEPLLNKSNKEVLRALKKIYVKSDDFPLVFTSDKGKEFLGNPIQIFFKDNDVVYYNSHGNTKAQFVERSIRTLKGKIFRFMTLHKTYRYLDGLKSLVFNLNHTFKNSLGTEPSKVTPKNATSVFYHLYGDTIHDIIEQDVFASKSEIKKQPFKINDFVRILVSKGVFEKKYNDTFSHEIFKIKDIFFSKPIQYQLEDTQGEEILGKFYINELQRVDVSKLHVQIGEIKKVFENKEGKSALVSWEYYGDKFDSIVPFSSIEKNN